MTLGQQGGPGTRVDLRVAVVIPCRNEALHISGLLDALAAQTRRPDEILVVDDRSTDATAERVREWQRHHSLPVVRLLTGPGKGPGPAVNAGIRATDAAVIMRMDGHAVPAPDYLARSLEVLETGARVGVVGGVWRVAPGATTSMARAIAAVVSHPIGSGGAGYRSPAALPQEHVSVETVPFGTFPRAVWERLGGFDETLAANEDFDFNYRARQAGWDVVLDRQISSTYVARPTLVALTRQYGHYGFWKLQMLRKQPRAFHWRQLPPALVAPWVLVSAGVAWLAHPYAGVIMASVYPVLVTLGALHVGLTRRVNPLSAAAAIVTVHLAWSVGFWRGLICRA